MDTRAIRSGSYKLIITRGVDSVLYNMDQDVEEMHDLFFGAGESTGTHGAVEPMGEQACCKDPLWIEEGWAEITNGLHERLMKNKIRDGTGSLIKSLGIKSRLFLWINRIFAAIKREKNMISVEGLTVEFGGFTLLMMFRLW